MNAIKCPHCEKEIDHLVSYATATCNCAIFKNGGIDLDGDLNEEYETDEWRCPKCNQDIVGSEEYAIKFLNGENV